MADQHAPQTDDTTLNEIATAEAEVLAADAALLDATLNFFRTYDEHRCDAGVVPYPLPKDDPKYARLVVAKERLKVAELASDAATARLELLRCAP